MSDTYPIRLPSGGKAFLILPDPFTRADAEHVCRWLELIAEDPPSHPKQHNDGGAVYD
ncbi:hypothetical protein [Achromobacter pulmonis]|uniref:hypothetical protein n=1 Tax=Achromobacter pulmonis TaxID=1389932 RepID=UPI0015E86311|nr:hypothetical protein [Achromobacter pulmonis]